MEQKINGDIENQN